MDLVVEDRVIVEVKSVELLARQHAKQLLTNLKLTNRQVGLLINFGAPTLREGLRRIVNGFEPSAAPRLRGSASSELHKSKQQRQRQQIDAEAAEEAEHAEYCLRGRDRGPPRAPRETHCATEPGCAAVARRALYPDDLDSSTHCARSE